MTTAESSAAWIVEREASATLLASRPLDDDVRTALRRASERFGAVAVAKRVDRDGRLLGLGECVVHPKGLHSVGRGLPATAHRFPREVDGSLNGAACFPHRFVDRLEVPRGPFGMLAWCLEARLRG